MDMILQRCNIRISNYVSCISCKGYQKVVNAIISGESNPKVLVTLIHKRTLNKHGRQVVEDSLNGFVSDTDRDILRQYRDERMQMEHHKRKKWDASANAGFTTGTPWIGIADNYKAINAAAQMDAPDSIRSFYKTLVALRKKMPVISAGKIEFLYPDNADLLAYRRYDGETELLVLCNLREREIAKPLPVGWTDAEKLLGNYPDTADTLRPYECVVLKK